MFRRAQLWIIDSMATVTLSVPPHLIKAARSKLGGGGSARVKEYLLCSLQSLADDRKNLSPDTIRQLMEGLRSPAIPVTDEFWEQKIKRYERRNRTRRPKRAA